MKKTTLKMDFDQTIVGEVPDVLGHSPCERTIQLHRRSHCCRITTVRNIGRQSNVTHERHNQHVFGRRVAHRKGVDRVWSEQHGWFGGVGVGIGKVSKKNLFNIKYLKNTNLTLHLSNTAFQKICLPVLNG